MIQDIQNNTLIICEDDYKKYILKELTNNSLFLNIKIMNKKEFFNDYLFKYDEKTISYLVNKYNYKVDIAKMYLNNLYCVEDKVYKSNKLNFLVDLKKELIENNLLIFNDKFKEFIKKYNILVIGYSYLEKYELDILNSLNATFYEEKNVSSKKKLYEFETLIDEINCVCKTICKLIKDGIDINKIKLVGITDNYINEVERLFSFYKIPLKLSKGSLLYSNVITKKFLDNYTSSMNDNILNIQNENKDIVKKIINICNKYVFESDALKVKSLIESDLKNTYIDNFKLKNYVEVVDLFYPFQDNYVFLMNFNEGIFPKTFKDEEYITDNIKEEVNLYSVNDKNKIIKESTIKKINSISNLVITYKKRDDYSEYYPSSLINKMNLIKDSYDNNILESYSYLNDVITYSKKLDDFIKYGSIDDDLKIYQSNLNDIGYRTYDNKFKGINSQDLKEYLNNSLVLSYSSLNNYNKCAFKYYLGNILKLEGYEEKFEAFIGSLFHSVLEKCLINDLNVDDEIKNYVSNLDRQLTNKEMFFVKKVSNDIKFVINVLNKQKEYTNLDKVMFEKNIVIDKSRDINIEFTGYIDKLLYKENEDNTLISIIDYKTGLVDIELKYLSYGLSLQLPIYLYLVKKSNLFVNPKFVGFYLQHVLDKEIIRDCKKNYEEEKSNNLKLQGYSNSEIHSLVEFDNSYENSSLIKGLKLKNDGNFSAHSKILSDNQIDKIIELTEKNIDDSIDNILNGNFNINPKKIGYEKDLGCLHCKFKDICNRKEDDFVILEDINSLDFLGGEDNAEMD